MKYYIFSLLGFAFFWNPVVRNLLGQHSSLILFYFLDVAGVLCLILYLITFFSDLFPILVKIQVCYWYIVLFFCLSFFPSFIVFLSPQSVFWIANIFIANFITSLLVSRKQYFALLTLGLIGNIALYCRLSRSQISMTHASILYACCISACVGFFRPKSDDKAAPLYSSAKFRSLKDRLENYVFFIQYVSHEMRIPLQGIRGLAGRLVSKGAFTNQHIQYLNILQSSCTQLLITASNVLDFSKFMSEYGVLNRTRCNLKQIICGVVEEMMPLSVLQNSEIEFYCNLTSVYIDGPKVTHIIRNLLSNALQNTQNGKISLQAFLMKGELLYISVIDTGVGISAIDINTIFDKFAQASFADKVDSSGIGLFIVSHFVRIHKGKIWVEQNIPNGAIFAFVLELQQSYAPTAPTNVTFKIKDRHSLGGENIFWHNVTEHTLRMATLWRKKALLYALLVDDDELSLISSRLILENVGFTVIQAKNCTAALKVLESRKVDVILLDVVIGRGNIHECIKQITNQSRDASIILQTGVLRSFLSDITLYKGVVGYLLKPYGTEDVHKILIALGQSK